MKKIIFFIGALMLTVMGSAYAGNVVVIVNKSVGLEAVSRTEIQQIFLGKVVHWSDGNRATPVILKQGSVHEDFLRDYLGKSTSQYDTFWKQAIFTGTGRPPKTLDADGEIVQFVSSTTGAVGYIGSDTPHASVKVIDVR